MKHRASFLTISIQSTRFNIFWLLYTWFYILLFMTISSEAFNDVADVLWLNKYVLPANLMMNTISLALAFCGVLITHIASKRDELYWTTINILVYVLMISWIFFGSLWILTWMT